MQIIVQIKLVLAAQQSQLIDDKLKTYIGVVNSIVSDFVSMGKVDKRTTAVVFAALPSAVKNQCIQDAKSVFKKYAKDMKSMERVNKKKPAEKQKVVKLPFLKKPVAI